MALTKRENYTFLFACVFGFGAYVLANNGFPIRGLILGIAAFTMFISFFISDSIPRLNRFFNGK